jgi:hypothetical protein
MRPAGDTDDAAYLPKPFTSQELLRRVQHTLEITGA